MRVMAELVPAIHVASRMPKDVDARDKPGHDGGESVTLQPRLGDEARPSPGRSS